MRAMLGRIDPTSPQANGGFRHPSAPSGRMAQRHYKGDGMFEVDFAISGRIDHDFTFPSIERFPMANAFVVLNRHADGSVRMDAPGFGPASNGGGIAILPSLPQWARWPARMVARTQTCPNSRCWMARWC